MLTFVLLVTLPPKEGVLILCAGTYLNALETMYGGQVATCKISVRFPFKVD